LTSLSSAAIGNGAGTDGRGAAGAADGGGASAGRVTENAETNGFVDTSGADAVDFVGSPLGGAGATAAKGAAPAGGRIGDTERPAKGSDATGGLVELEPLSGAAEDVDEGVVDGGEALACVIGI
jgi:hypothetical protein